MTLVASECHGAEHGSPLPAAVAENDDEHWRLTPRRVPRAHPLPLLGRVALHLEGGVAQFRQPHLLHPEDEVVVDVDIGIDQRLLYLRVPHNDELPRLRVRARHRPAAGLENLVDISVGHRVWPQIAHAHATGEQFAKLLIFGRRLFVCVRHHQLPGEAASAVASGAGPAGIVPSMANVVWGRDQANAWAIKLALEPSPDKTAQGRTK